MKFRFTIGKKITVGFGILAMVFLIFISYSYTNWQMNRNTISNIKDFYLPSEFELRELSELVEKSTLLMKNWVFIENASGTPDKNKLEKLINVDYPRSISNLESYAEIWDSTHKKQFDLIKHNIKDSLFVDYSRIIKKLNSPEDYVSSYAVIHIHPLFSKTGHVSQLSNQIQNQIQSLYANISELRQIKETHSALKHKRSSNTTMYLGISILILSVLIAMYIYITLTKPIIFVKNELIQMSKGILISKKIQNRTDEIGDMLVALKGLNKGLQMTSEFAKEIGKGNYSAEYQPMSDEDQLGNSLIDLRNDLEKANKEAIERKEQDQIRNWTTQGLANFADILRFNNTNLNEFGQNIISNIVEYMTINQGGLFIYNDEDPDNPYLDLIAMYAYSRNKFANKKVLPGEGLVGISFAEKETIYMTEVPNSYIEVTSGLGEAPPNSILIVPLKIEENVLGIIELASFNEFKPHEISFIEKVGESIAATLNNVRINNSTARLLEQSKAQAEAMHAQEEEMRQNLEELQATQEEAARKKTEMEQALMDARLEIEQLKEKIQLKG